MRKSAVIFCAFLLSLSGAVAAVVAGSEAVDAHTGATGHGHPDNCHNGTWDTTGECLVYAAGSRKITGVGQRWLSALELPNNVAPESVFLDWTSVDGDMDISAADMQKYRAFYSRTHFTERNPDGSVYIGSDGQVREGDSISSVLGTGSARVDALFSTDIWDEKTDNGYAEDRKMIVNFVDGTMCNASKWGKNWDYLGWFWGKYPSDHPDLADKAPGRIRVCLQAVVRMWVKYGNNDGEYISFRVKDNHNGPDSVFGEHAPPPPPPASIDSEPPLLSASLSSARRWVSEDNGTTEFTVSLSRPLRAGESAVVPITVKGAKAYRDWNIRFPGRLNGPGVTRTATGAKSEVTFTEGGQTATFVLIGRPDDGTHDRVVTIRFGKGARTPSASGVHGDFDGIHGDFEASGRIKITIRDEDS